MKAIYLDMDGTIADLYNFPDWLPKLKAGDTTPYECAKPLVDLDELASILNRAQEIGITIGVVSWLCKGSSLDYARRTRAAKLAWLKKHVAVEFDEVKIVHYGRPKQQVVNSEDAILVDDSQAVCGQWGKHKTLDAKSPEWMATLAKMIDSMME
jgi:hypothetical protein